MHRSEERERARCVGCGEVIAPQRERGFAIDPDTVLCAECALRRGGSYDDTLDRWVTAPRVDDLRIEEA
ncbi:MAG: hypothetical protein JSU66_03915 [Deltaproteobacteria bacterium]|nr:MAG: hypothetical protein JSU66_03915 [Deltaproteobacteria bacterium]